MISRLFLPLFVFLFFHCGQNDPTRSEITDFVYPMQVGNQWDYQRTFSLRPDSAGTELDTVSNASVTIRTEREVFIDDSTMAFVFHQLYSESGGYNYEYEAWYNNLEDGLYNYASEGGGIGFPKPLINKGFNFKEKFYGSVQQITESFCEPLTRIISSPDSHYYTDPPNKIIQYPLDLNSEWLFFESDLHPSMRVVKKVVSIENIDVPAGKFSCYKIQYLYEMNNEGEWDEDIIGYDYICSKGLIMRYFEFKDVGITSPDDPQSRETVKARDVTVLTNINF